MTLSTSVIYGSVVTGAVGAVGAVGVFLAYKKRQSIVWYLTSCYSNIKFYTQKKHDISVEILHLRNANTCVPLPLELQDNYDDHTEVYYSWNNNKYRVIYQPFLKVVFPPHDKEKLLCSFIGDYEFYVRNEKNVIKIHDSQRLKIIYEIMGPLCDFYTEIRGIVSPRNSLLHYKVINANEEFLMYDLIMDEEKVF